MSARTAPVAAAAALVLLLAGCDRGGQQAAAPQAQTPASAPVTAASGPAAASSAPAMSAPLVPQEVPQAAGGLPADVEAGRVLATQGAGPVTACVACHGAAGEGNAQTGFPRLAALGSIYLAHQLESYANGSRTNPVMTPIASAMTPDQRRQAAAFYATLAPAAGSAGAAPASSAPNGATAAGPRPAGGQREPTLVGRGDEARGVQACANCHGPQAIGDASTNPYLAGQHANYLVAAMAAWRDGTRRNDPSGQMPAIAKALGEADAKSLAAYFAQLAPPLPRNAQALAPQVASTRAAVQSGPVAATAPAQGVGTEQGAPLTGGAQAQGAGGAATQPAQTPSGGGSSPR